MNLEINIKVPIGESGVSISQGTDAASTAQPIPLIPPGLPGLPGPQSSPELPEEPNEPYRFEGSDRTTQQPENGSYETNGHGAGSYGVAETSSERDLQPPPIEQLRRFGGDRGNEFGPPDPATLALQAPQEDSLGQPPGLEGLSFDETGGTASEAPPSLDELGVLGAAEASSAMPPSIGELEEMTKATRGSTRSKARRAPKKAGSVTGRKTRTRKASTTKEATAKAEAPG